MKRKHKHNSQLPLWVRFLEKLLPAGWQIGKSPPKGARKPKAVTLNEMRDIMDTVAEPVIKQERDSLKDNDFFDLQRRMHNIPEEMDHDG